jgi:hypothetical protein
MGGVYVPRYNGLPLTIRYYDKNVKCLPPGFYEQKAGIVTKHMVIFVLPKRFKKRFNKSKAWHIKEDKRKTDHLLKVLAK